MPINQEILEKALLEKGLITEKALKSMKDYAQAQGVSLEKTLFERQNIPDDKLGEIIAEQYKVPFVKLYEKTILESLLRIVPFALAANQFVIPFEKTGNTLKLAVNNPENYELVSFIEKKTGIDIEVYYATQKDIKNALKAYNRNVNEKFNKLLKNVMKDPTKIESLEDATKILDTIILFAYQNNASDIHIEPHEEFIVIRYRIDGILQIITELPIEILDLLTTRTKVLASLRTDEHRTPQDGRFKIELEGNEITLRVSITPVYDGEKTVLRILNSGSQELNLSALGYSDKSLKVINRNILKTNGILLITGPTGSGKTTTLYSALKLLNSPEVNISTIEDPIEYKLDGINQIQVNKKTGLTFASGLRVLLRQDPDIIMVGEIRDEETAGIAINASLTGHLVFATLHTNDAASTLPRMKELGIEGFLLGATVKMVMAQRLVRTICSKCKKEYKVTMEELKTLGDKFNFKKNLEEVFKDTIATDENLKSKIQNDSLIFSKGEGCDTCGGTGFKGRTTISEILEVSDETKLLINKDTTPKELEDVAVKEGMVPIFMDGMIKVLEGATTIEEVLRVMRS